MPEQGDQHERRHRTHLENEVHELQEELHALRRHLAEGFQEVLAVVGKHHRSEHVHVHLHVDDPITIIMAAPAPSNTATGAVLTIGGSNMPGAITIDTTNETATVKFVDDKGNDTSGPSNATFTYASSDEAVATVAADSANPMQADITPVGLGSADISVTSNGTALEADGATPIPDPSPVTVSVSAGAAAGESFVLSA